jgi:hypothetical protein
MTHEQVTNFVSLSISRCFASTLLLLVCDDDNDKNSLTTNNRSDSNTLMCELLFCYLIIVVNGRRARERRVLEGMNDHHGRRVFLYGT